MGLPGWIVMHPPRISVASSFRGINPNPCLMRELYLFTIVGNLGSSTMVGAYWGYWWVILIMWLILWWSLANSLALALVRVTFGEAVVDVDLEWEGVVEVGWRLGGCLHLGEWIGDWAGEMNGELLGVL